MSDSATAISQQNDTTAAKLGLHACGYLIDVIPACVLGLLALIPIVGAILAGLVLTPYWLLRDVAGASLGKIILRTRIVTKDGQPAGVGARILRNVPLAIGPAFAVIPILGYFLAPAVAFVAILVESILLATGGERLGDRMAKTAVVSR